MKRGSTKMEEAWFVDPDLLAGDDTDQAGAVIDVDAPRRNETLTLSDKDYEEAPDLEGKGTDSGSVRYREVSLKGAIMAPEDAEPLSSVLSRPSGVVDRLKGVFPERSSLVAKVEALRPKVKALAGKVAVVADLFEQGRVPPIWLAAISFFAGVITTLIGVFLAL